MTDIRDSAERMAGLAEKRGPVHPWWQLAKCVLVILDDPKYADAAKRMTEEFNKRESRKFP